MNKKNKQEKQEKIKSYSNEELLEKRKDYIEDLKHLYTALSVVSATVSIGNLIGRLGAKAAIKCIEKKIQRIHFEMARRKMIFNK